MSHNVRSTTAQGWRVATAHALWILLVRWLDSTQWRATAHVLTGAVVGAALALVLQCSPRSVLTTMLVTAVLSWLAAVQDDSFSPVYSP